MPQSNNMLRKLSLALISVSEKDRDWILDQLSTEQKNILLPVMADASSLDLTSIKHFDSEVFDSLLREDNLLSSESGLELVAYLKTLPDFWRIQISSNMKGDDFEPLVGINEEFYSFRSDDALVMPPKMLDCVLCFIKRGD